MRLAALPWYALEEIRPALERLWGRLARRLEHLPDVPPALSWSDDYDSQWRNAGLLLGQACGYDAVFGYADTLRIVATPRWSFDGCEGPNYRAFVVTRANIAVDGVEQLRGLRCAINTSTSHSGMNILRAMVAPYHRDGRFFSRVVASGSHEASLGVLRADEADVCSIDCITWGLLARHRPAALQGLHIVAHSDSFPAPPFVTSARTDAREVDALREAFASELGDLDGEPAAALGLLGVERLDDSAYRSIADCAEEAERWGYNLLPHAMA